MRAAPPPAVYVAYDQLAGDFPTNLAVRVEGPLGPASSAIQQALATRLPGAPPEVRLLSAQVEATIVRERMMASLAGGFGLLALVLACVGLYGLLAYGVAQRIHEIGIRMALGARRTHVAVLVLRNGARLILVGVAMGVPAAWAASHWVESMLFGLTPGDPVALGGAALVLAMAALLAAYLPAHRASRVDPLVALRHE